MRTKDLRQDVYEPIDNLTTGLRQGTQSIERVIAMVEATERIRREMARRKLVQVQGL